LKEDDKLCFTHILFVSMVVLTTQAQAGRQQAGEVDVPLVGAHEDTGWAAAAAGSSPELPAGAPDGD
jgi:hypothetical protein